ncbi:MAG: MBL fold metallo-hydrolase RNA specificity domain-containing protein, partial [Promethearchaeota archaeon]
RNDIERKFVENVIGITENGGKVLIPAFGVARSQEALMILQKYNYNGKIFIDGLAKKICDIYLTYPKSLKSSDLFKKSLKKAQFISKKGRNIAKNSIGAIIAPSGMLQGGASISFVKSFLKDPQSAIYLVGYQAEGSPGRKLLEEGIFEYREKNRSTRITDDFTLEAKCDREYFDFSSHADGEHLLKFISNLKFQNDSKNIFCVHGDPKATTSLSGKMIKNNYNSVAPEMGESYKI